MAEEENSKSGNSELLKYIGILLIGAAIGLFIANSISAPEFIKWFITLGALILGIILLVISMKK